ncbi:LCP family protein [Candidatus Roizmanbacteria bacterium]|nr:LCP family protein [Candidatus Roizmanbacteria bacterium]
MNPKLKLIGLFAAILLTLILLIAIKPYYLFLTKTLHISIIKTLLSRDSLKTYNNQVNILLLGIPGSTHEGPDLSDSIIVAGYNLKTNQITTISLPRDIWSDTLRDKINTAYSYGNAKKSDGGLKLAKAEISSIVGLPIHYAAVLDFDQFKELIDYLGGVEVEVDRSFTDEKFPIPGREDDKCDGDPEFKCRYETVSFKKGHTFMNGETALKFVRSRHGDNAEGSDFARTKRQQKVLVALKNKLLEFVKGKGAKELEKLYGLFEKLIHRDITNQQLAIIVKNVVLKGKLKQKEIVLSENFFYVPNYLDYDGKYVLIPNDGTYREVHNFIACNLENKPRCKEPEKN